jgi:hypothetical protein
MTGAELDEDSRRESVRCAEIEGTPAGEEMFEGPQRLAQITVAGVLDGTEVECSERFRKCGMILHAV